MTFLRRSPLPLNTAQLQGSIDIHETIPTATTTGSTDDIMFDHSEDIRTLPPPPRYSRVWKTLILSVAIGLVSGSLYGFGRYSRDLRDTLKLTQSQVQRFGILLDTGNYLGHPATGWAYDKLGSRLSCLLAAVIVFISYGSIHLGLWTTLPLWIVNVGFFGVGFGSGLSYIVGLGRATKDFHGTSVLGRVVGLVSSGYGLSSTLVGITYNRFGLEKFFLFWAVLVAIVNLMGAFIFSDQLFDGGINEVEVHHIEDERQNNVAPANDYFNAHSMSTAYVRNNENIDERLLLSTTTLTSDRASGIASGIETPTEAIQWVSWRRLDFWLLFLSFGCITGSGLFVINNVSTMVQSIGGQDAMTGRLVIFLSMCSVFGRLFMGSLADHPKLCKLDLLRYLSLTMAFGLFIGCIAGASTMALWMTVAMVAMPYGGSWVLIVGILVEFYGDSNFGKDYGLLILSPAISGFVFNTISAWLYEYNADKDSGICTGEVCYRNSYLITGIAALVGCLIISRISKPIYQRNLDDCSNDSSSSPPLLI